MHPRMRASPAAFAPSFETLKNEQRPKALLEKRTLTAARASAAAVVSRQSQPREATSVIIVIVVVISIIIVVTIVIPIVIPIVTIVIIIVVIPIITIVVIISHGARGRHQKSRRDHQREPFSSSEHRSPPSSQPQPIRAREERRL